MFQIEEADIFKETKQFTYKDGPQFVFMDLVMLILICMLCAMFLYVIEFLLTPNKKR